MVSTKKTGVLGGTFDPVHLGHLAMAETTANELGLEQVILVPAGQPVCKTGRKITPKEQRLEMIRMAVKDKPKMKESTIETERSGPSYTIDTLKELKLTYGQDTEIYFILGWDSLEQLPMWREPENIVKLCKLAAVPRPGCKKPDMEKLEKMIPGLKESVIILKEPNIDISATEIREKVCRGESIDDMVPEAVAGYIKKHKLYCEAGG